MHNKYKPNAHISLQKTDWWAMLCRAFSRTIWGIYGLPPGTDCRGMTATIFIITRQVTPAESRICTTVFRIWWSTSHKTSGCACTMVGFLCWTERRISLSIPLRTWAAMRTSRRTYHCWWPAGEMCSWALVWANSTWCDSTRMDWAASLCPQGGRSSWAWQKVIWMTSC